MLVLPLDVNYCRHCCPWEQLMAFILGLSFGLTARETAWEPLLTSGLNSYIVVSWCSSVFSAFSFSSLILLSHFLSLLLLCVSPSCPVSLPALPLPAQLPGPFFSCPQTVSPHPSPCCGQQLRVAQEDIAPVWCFVVPQRASQNYRKLCSRQSQISHQALSAFMNWFFQRLIIYLDVSRLLLENTFPRKKL